MDDPAVDEATVCTRRRFGADVSIITERCLRALFAPLCRAATTLSLN